LAVIGPYISAVEHHLQDAPFLVKGINLTERDAKMTALLNYFVYAETDYCRFDMTISKDWIEEVQDPVLASYFEDPQFLLEILSLAHMTKGLSEMGLLYNVNGTRCSGDAHTSIGNGLINLFNTWALFYDLPIPDWLSYHEGDDGIMAFTADHDVTDRIYALDSMGFKVKLFVTNDISETSFCGRFLCTDGIKLLSYADPYRSLAKLHITLSMGKLPTLLLAKCLSYAYTDGSTPIIGPIVQQIAQLLMNDSRANLRKAKLIAKFEKLRRYGAHTDYTLVLKDVDPVLRDAFAVRTGISPSEQINLELYYTNIFKTYIPNKFYQIVPTTDVVWETEDSLVHYMPTLHNVH